jgi:hypothetical protein
MLMNKSFLVLPQSVTCRSSLGISIALSQIAINVHISVTRRTDSSSVLYFRCSIYEISNAPMPSLLRTKPRILSAVSRALFMFLPATVLPCWVHLFAAFCSDLSVTCRTIHLHIQICWNQLHFNKTVGIVLNVIGWMFPAIMLGLVFVFAEITYTISDHCSIRVDWITRLLIIPLIVEISLALFVQFCTFAYCVNVYLKSLSEPPPPTTDLFEGAGGSANSFQSTRYPYRKAFARIRKVCSALVGLTVRS